MVDFQKMVQDEANHRAAVGEEIIKPVIEEMYSTVKSHCPELDDYQIWLAIHSFSTQHLLNKDNQKNEKRTCNGVFKILLNTQNNLESIVEHIIDYHPE